MAHRQPGDIVKQMRTGRAWTQSHVAAIAGVSLRTVQRLETIGSASQETLMAIANAFDVDVSELVACIPLSSIQNGGEPATIQNPAIMVIPDNPSFSRKTLVWGIGTYAALVVAVVVFTWFFFTAEAYSLEAAGNENRSAVSYRKFLNVSAIVLAMGLGFWSAFYGAVSKRWFFGVLVLGAGVVFSVSAFALLPWLQYPNDQYSPGAVWMFVGLLPLVVAWSLVNIGFLALKRL